MELVKALDLMSKLRSSFNAAKEWEILGHRQSDLWAVELGINCSTVYGKYQLFL